MIPVSPDHSAHVVNRELLPCLIANVLPSRNLFEYQKANFVTGIEKMPRLRIVRSSHDIAFELIAQDLRIATLNATRHRLADKRERLMTIEPTQLDDFAI